MGNDRRRGRRHPGRPLWLALILFALTTTPPATPYGAVGPEEQPKTHPCPLCGSKLRSKSGWWVCRSNPEEHYFTSEQLGLG